jgi:hypothetical protein
MTVVVIPVADEPTNPTLPLAIESIRRHTEYDILTIGHDFGVAEHVHLDQSPVLRDRWANTDRAMRLACEHLPTFIWSADDTYWTRPAEPIRWALGDLSDAALMRGAPGRRKTATIQWLLEHGLPTWDYEAHVPLLVESAAMIAALDIIATNPTLDKRTIYGNLTGQPDLIAPDVKVRTPEIPDTPWLSSIDTLHLDKIAPLVRQDTPTHDY